MSDQEGKNLKVADNKDALHELKSVEKAGLEVGRAFHAFRFTQGGSVDQALGELKALEANQVNVGRAFHAFRFNSDSLRELNEVEENELAVGGAFHAFRFK